VQEHQIKGHSGLRKIINLEVFEEVPTEAYLMDRKRACFPECPKEQEAPMNFRHEL
jgi:hypothetical protein